MLKNYKGNLNSVFIEYYDHSKISYCPGETTENFPNKAIIAES